MARFRSKNDSAPADPPAVAPAPVASAVPPPPPSGGAAGGFAPPGGAMPGPFAAPGGVPSAPGTPVAAPIAPVPGPVPAPLPAATPTTKATAASAFAGTAGVPVRGEAIDGLLRQFESSNEQKVAAAAATAAHDDSMNENAPVVQVVNLIVAQAMRDRTSDVHIEPMDERLRVRFRIDGTLVEAFSLPIGIHLALVSRLKIMSGMNIVERRRPQDGQFSTVIDDKPVDVRVASVSTVFGEKVVLRLLDKSRSLIGLSQLGFPRDTYDDYSNMVHSPFGMVLCAGPTGAGKTTTLYATLLEVNSVGKNIVTIEDPVEYIFPGINQVQTNEGAGVTFATGLKAMLRQDPDVMLVGEIRDIDTARIAIQSALTGHFVLSSVHGTDAVAALHRFLDMGIESFLIASAVVGVVGQRLLRKICSNCKEPYTPSTEDLAFYERQGGYPKSQFFHGAGCDMCAGTGYRDRQGIYELLRITPELRRLIVGWATQDELRKLAVAQGMRTLAMEALSLVDQDVTTIAEVVRTLFGS